MIGDKGKGVEAFRVILASEEGSEDSKRSPKCGPSCMCISPCAIQLPKH